MESSTRTWAVDRRRPEKMPIDFACGFAMRTVEMHLPMSSHRIIEPENGKLWVDFFSISSKPIWQGLFDVHFPEGNPVLKVFTPNTHRRTESIESIDNRW